MAQAQRKSGKQVKGGTKRTARPRASGTRVKAPQKRQPPRAVKSGQKPRHSTSFYSDKPKTRHRAATAWGVYSAASGGLMGYASYKAKVGAGLLTPMAGGTMLATASGAVYAGALNYGLARGIQYVYSGHKAKKELTARQIQQRRNAAKRPRSRTAGVTSGRRV